MAKTIALDSKSADRITALTLKEYRACLKRDLADFRGGNYQRLGDVAKDIKLLEALNIVIDLLGEE